MISHGSSGVLFEVSRLCSLLLRFDCPPTVDAAAIWWRLLVTWYTPVSGRLVADSAEPHYRFWRVHNGVNYDVIDTISKHGGGTEFSTHNGAMVGTFGTGCWLTEMTPGICIFSEEIQRKSTTKRLKTKHYIVSTSQTPIIGEMVVSQPHQLGPCRRPGYFILSLGCDLRALDKTVGVMRDTSSDPVRETTKVNEQLCGSPTLQTISDITDRPQFRGKPVPPSSVKNPSPVFVTVSELSDRNEVTVNVNRSLISTQSKTTARGTAFWMASLLDLSLSRINMPDTIDQYLEGPEIERGMQSERRKTKPISLSFFLGPNINRPTVDTSACVSSAITLPDLSAVFRLDASSFPTLPGDNSSALCHFCSPNRGLR
ncbi:hypothetical protein J6590_082788 [Homalodisca vitripennis]|nr:hypothetical protein J6590_082788 [Homalodisca vitripennis]